MVFPSYLLPLTLRLLLWIPRSECNPAGKLAIEADFEGIRSGPGQGDIEDENRPSFDVHYAGRGLAELNGALSAHELGSGLVHEPNADGVDPDLGAPPAHPEHQMGPGVDSGKVGEPDVLKHAEHAELALLVDQGVIGDDREIEVQLS
jgi:hypothetical protein